MSTHTTTDPLAAHTETTYEVWVADAQGVPLYRYRDNLIYSVARHWADGFNKEYRADVPAGSTFVAVRATTTRTLA
jgi:hypothetical protein